MVRPSEPDTPPNRKDLLMLVTRNTLQLRERDLVQHHGMRIRLGAPNVQPIRAGQPIIVSWPGHVENADSICDPASPAFDPFLRSFLRGGNAYPGERDVWHVQGNVYARWQVDLDSNEARAETAGVLPTEDRVAS